MEQGHQKTDGNPRWWDRLLPEHIQVLEERLNRVGTGEEAAKVVEEWRRKYEPPRHIQDKAKALLAETGWGTLRQRIQARIRGRVDVFSMIGFRFDEISVALQMGIALAADGEYFVVKDLPDIVASDRFRSKNDRVTGAEAVALFLQRVDCTDAVHPKNAGRLSELLGLYRECLSSFTALDAAA